MNRCRTGKHLALTARDIAIFRALSRYRYLRSTYLHAFAGGKSKTRFKERLGDLYHEGYLDRPQNQWRFANARYFPVVHELANGGAQSLRHAGVQVEDQRTWLRNPHVQYEHALLTCDVLASIELGLPSGTRFISWPEIMAKAPKGRSAPIAFEVCGRKLVPDAMFGIGYQNASGTEAYRFFAVEIDRATMPIVRSQSQSALLPKLTAYGAVLDQKLFKSVLGLPSLLVLTVTTNEKRLHNILKVLAERSESFGAFLFGYFPEPAPEPITRLVSSPWWRARHDAIDLSRP